MSAPELDLFNSISSFSNLTHTTALPYHIVMVFIETSTFTKLIAEYLTDADAEIWMITLYAKNEISTIPGYVFREIAEESKNG